MYDYNFLEAVDHLILLEGGYINDPIDPGGETKYGITKRTYPHLNIKDLTRDEAVNIYFKDWWLKYRFNEYHPILGRKMLEMSVNMGYKRAAKILQQALSDYFLDRDLLAIDGIVGKKTKKYLKDVLYPRVLLHFIRQNQIDYYKWLIERRPTFKKFKNGWFNRAVST